MKYIFKANVIFEAGDDYKTPAEYIAKTLADACRTRMDADLVHLHELSVEPYPSEVLKDGNTLEAGYHDPISDMALLIRLAGDKAFMVFKQDKNNEHLTDVTETLKAVGWRK